MDWDAQDFGVLILHRFLPYFAPPPPPPAQSYNHCLAGYREQGAENRDSPESSGARMPFCRRQCGQLEPGSKGTYFAQGCINQRHSSHCQGHCPHSGSNQRMQSFPSTHLPRILCSEHHSAHTTLMTLKSPDENAFSSLFFFPWIYSGIVEELSFRTNKPQWVHWGFGAGCI